MTEHISCNCKCKFDGRKCKSNQMWNHNKCWRECNNSVKHLVCKKDYVWNPGTCACENNYAYMKSFIDDSAVKLKKLYLC